MKLTLHIGINARRSNAEGWGDQPFAQGLARGFEALGHGAQLFYRDERPELTGQNDAVIRIVGPHLDEPVTGVSNLLWMISPPNLAPLATLRRYQKVFFASMALARFYASQGIRAAYLPQATDPEVFHPEARAEGQPQYDVTFVGNLAPRAPRENVIQAIATGADVRVWGQGWEGVIPARNFGGARLPTGELAQVYAASRIVLNSHMPVMSMMGFMSNRSFDALACGASVLSDKVAQFSDESLPWLVQADSKDELEHALQRLLAGSGPDRAAVAASVIPNYSFAARAITFAEQAQKMLVARDVATTALTTPTHAPMGGARLELVVSDVADGVAPGESRKLGAWLDRQLQGQGVDLTLQLCDPSSAPTDLDPPDAMRRAAIAIERIGAVIARAAGFATLKVVPPGTEARQGVVHSLISDHRAAQKLALDHAPPPALEQLFARAQRLLDVDREERHPLGWSSGLSDHAQSLTRFKNNRPLYAHSPEGFSREKGKRHLVLWPRNAAVEGVRPVGVFLHLYYADLAPVFRDRLAALDAAYHLYISTDTEAKAAAIRAVFPQATVHVQPNRGRDVRPKLYGFPGAYATHDIVLHLHGKKSPHANALDQWLKHCLDCLLPSRGEVNRILSLFQSIPELGLVAPLTYPAVLGAAHWGDNFDIAQEIAQRLTPIPPLPEDANLDFPVGSMFWARTAALRPLLELKLDAHHFPREAGQVDATTAHAIERLFGVVCRATGHRLVRVAPMKSNIHKAHQVIAKNNGEVRAALQQGRLGA